MSMSDLIADSLTRIRNAQRANHEYVEVNTNNVVEAILEILKQEGFVKSVKFFKDKAKKKAKVELKYYMGKPVIKGLDRVSTPGRRIYSSWGNITPTLNNIGVSIFSTPKGVVTGKEAKYQHVGGEYLCKVW